MKSLSRRRFLKNSACLSMASTSLFSGITQLGAIASASAQTSGSDYKALVCVLLAGGADSFNILVPTDTDGYSEYAGVRADIALPQSQLLSLSGALNNGKQLGLHPALANIQGLFNQGNAAFLANVGTLIEPTSPQAIANNTARLPLGLYSHSDQIAQWQTSLPDIRSKTGWGGRLGDLLQELNTNAQISTNISLAGSNEFQSGVRNEAFNLTTSGNGVISLNGFGQQDGFNSLKHTAIDKIYTQEYANLLRQAYRNTYKNSIASNQVIGQAIANVAPFSTQFENDGFSSQLHMVAKTIAASQALGIRRQTFFVQFGGWDHHDEVLNSMAGMLPVLDKGLGAFYSALAEIGQTNNVTSFTTSDFGRTLTSNGRGTDHGWGGNHLILGGAVKGGQVYGTYPSLALGNPLDTGRGVLVPTTSTDEYFAELALWMGTGANQLSDVLPNIGRFYNTTSSTAPIGFLL